VAKYLTYSQAFQKIQGAAIEREDVQLDVLRNRIEYKKENKNTELSCVKCHLIYAYYFLKNLRLLSTDPGVLYITVTVTEN
jgi:hypothetical protein